MILLSFTLSDILASSVVGILVIFTVLTLLVLAFTLLGKIMTRQISKSESKQGVEVKEKKRLNSYEATAISYALHLFLSEQHDDETNILTLKRIDKKYSPWSSKIYSVNEQ